MVLDDLNVVLGNDEWEQALFHLFNRVRENDGHLIISADQAPKQLPVQLADLASRLVWGVTYQIERLHPEERALALVLRARQRGLLLSEDVARFIVARGPEQMEGLGDILDHLDRASLTHQRKLTIPFVKEEMDW